MQGPAAVTLPEGILWRRAATQVATRLGAFPGDRVLVLGPPERDLAVLLADRLPRIRFIQFGDEGAPFGWSDAAAPTAGRVVRLRGDLFRPPVVRETLDALLVVFPVPVLAEADHTRLVQVWAPRLAPLGKWFSIVAMDGPRDPRLKAAERDLRETGFEKVRSMRLALGRMGQTLFLMTARWPGMDEDDADDE